MKTAKIIMITSATALLMLIIAFFVIKEANKTRAELPELYPVPEFSFINMDGEKVSLQQLTGRISVVDFIFTRCPGPCPMMGAKMADLYEKYRNYDQVQFLSFTVDPEHDSLAVLREYANSLGVDDNRWKFLRADKKDVVLLYEGGFKLAGELPAYHSTKFILVDQKGMIRGYYSTEDEVSFNILKTHLKDLAKKIL